MINEFLTSNKASMRLARTILQGVIGVLIAQLPALIGNAQLDPVWTATIVAASMAVLSPIMAALGEAEETREGEHAKEIDEDIEYMG